ncbi:MAG: DUF542 domain-containing protein [bacterium]|nr:DUF542 domain-containing protein [bacterium]
MENSAIATFITQRPSRAEVFLALEIDYSVVGSQTLAEVCKAKGISVNEVLKRIVDHDQRTRHTEEFDWSKSTLRELVQHIEANHHQYLRTVLPKLFDQLQGVAQLYGKEHPEILELQKLFGAFRFAVEAHLLSEEKVLFPTIVALESGELQWQGDHSSSEEIKVRIREHDTSADDIKQMRQITNNFCAPDDTGESYRSVLDGLCQLEKDLHLHIHKENNILFPRASQLAMEQLKAGSHH